MNQCCHFTVNCVNFNRTVSLMEILFCQKSTNQFGTQQQLVKMPTLALKAVLLLRAARLQAHHSLLLFLHVRGVASPLPAPCQDLLPHATWLLTLQHFSSSATLRVHIIYQTTTTRFQADEQSKHHHQGVHIPLSFSPPKGQPRRCTFQALGLFFICTLCEGNLIVFCYSLCIKWNELRLNEQTSYIWKKELKFQSHKHMGC